MIPKFKFGDKVVFTMYNAEYKGVISEIKLCDLDENGRIDDILYNIEVKANKQFVPIIYKNIHEKNILPVDHYRRTK